MSISQRKIRLFLLGLALMAVAVVIIVITRYSIKYRNFVRSNYQRWMIQATDSLYQLKVDKININVFTRNITIKGIDLIPDTLRFASLQKQQLAPGAFTQIHVPEVTIDDIMWENLFLNNEIMVGEVKVKNPIIHIHLATDTLQTKTSPSSKEDEMSKVKNNVLKAFNRSIQSLNAEQFSISEPKIFYELYPRKNTDPYFISMGGSVVLNNWRYTPSMPKDTTLLFYAQDGKVLLKNITFYKPHADYAYRMDTLLFNPETYSCELLGFSMFNFYTPEQWNKVHKIQKPQYHLSIPRLFLRRLNWQGFIHNNWLLVDTLELFHPQFKVQVDRNNVQPDEEDKRNRFPVQLLHTAHLPYNVNNLLVRQGDVYYKETSQQTGRSAVVAFNNIDMQVKHITNMIKENPNDSIIEIKGAGMFMNNSPMQVQLNLLNRPWSTNFTVQIKLNQIDEHDLNTISNNLALMEVKRLHIDEVQLTGKGNADSIVLDGYLKYKHLLIALKKMDSLDNTLTTKPVLTFLANQLALRTENPDAHGQLKMVQVHFQNDKKKSIVNLIWKGIFQAALKTALQDQDFYTLMKEQELRKQKKIERKKLRQQKRKERKWRKDQRKENRK